MPIVMDIQVLRDSIRYCPKTGRCWWKNRPLCHFENAHRRDVFNTKYFDKLVGYVHTDKHGNPYIWFQIGGRKFQLHRAIYAMMTGSWPHEVGHDDGDGLNNRWENLSDVTRTQNRMNIRRRQPRSLPIGVSLVGGKYYANIGFKTKKYYLGVFKDLEGAASARRAAEVKFGFHPDHGKLVERCEK